MADKRPKKVIRTTPRAPFVGYPKLTKADTKFKAEGAYQVNIALPADDPWAVKAVAAIDKMAEASLADAIENDKRDAAKRKKTPWALNDQKPYDNELDKETGEETGRVVFKFKATASGTYKSGPKKGESWTRSVKLFDGLGNAYKGAEPWSGTEGCVAFEMVPYAVSAEIGAGVKLALESAQIIKLVAGGERSANDFGFGKHDDAEDLSGETDESAEDTKPKNSDSKPNVAEASDDDDF